MCLFLFLLLENVHFVGDKTFMSNELQTNDVGRHHHLQDTNGMNSASVLFQ